MLANISAKEDWPEMFEGDKLNNRRECVSAAEPCWQSDEPAILQRRLQLVDQAAEVVVITPINIQVTQLGGGPRINRDLRRTDAPEDV